MVYTPAQKDLIIECFLDLRNLWSVWILDDLNSQPMTDLQRNPQGFDGPVRDARRGLTNAIAALETERPKIFCQLNVSEKTVLTVLARNPNRVYSTNDILAGIKRLLADQRKKSYPKQPDTENHEPVNKFVSVSKRKIQGDGVLRFLIDNELVVACLLHHNTTDKPCGEIPTMRTL